MAAKFTALKTVDYCQGPIFASRFSRDGKWLATASLDNTVCLWDVEKKQRRMQYKHRGKTLLLSGEYL
jgi:WD40 repeat protein